MTDKLYIIGNGFDLHHGLRTSYFDFAKCLKENNRNLYDTLENYISYPSSDKDLWSRFEENLANLDADEILSEHTDTLPNYVSDDFRDRDRYVFPDIMDEHHQKLTTGLFEQFEGFIQKVEFPQTSFEYKIELDKQASFLTFNYTDTLERLYKVERKNIVYLHNSAFHGSEAIILGHGIDPVNFEEKRPEPPDDLDEEDFERWHDQHNDYDYSYDTGKENLMRYFKDTFKPTSEIIQRHNAFFEGLGSFKEVFVLGHSISSVDLPYFKKIITFVNQNTKWSVSYYNTEEKIRHLNTLKTMGLEEKNINLFELLDMQENNKQLKIDF